MTELSQSQLKEILEYCPDSGVFRRIKTVGRRAKKGQTVGWKNGCGYLNVEIFGKTYKLHRLAFLYMEGEFPPKFVDHINRNRSDNRWSNLRKATFSENMKNQSLAKNNTSGFCGVHFDDHGRGRPRWRVALGSKNASFYCFLDAVSARINYNKNNGFSDSHGEPNV